MQHCDYCDTMKDDEEVYAIEDPWGGHHGFICETCGDEQAEQATEMGG